MQNQKYQDALEKGQGIVALDPEAADPEKVQVISKRKLDELTKSQGPKQWSAKTWFLWLGIASFVTITFLIIRWNWPQILAQRLFNLATPTALIPNLVAELKVSSTTIPGI